MAIISLFCYRYELEVLLKILSLEAELKKQLSFFLLKSKYQLNFKKDINN